MTYTPSEQKTALLVVSLSSFILPLMASSVNVALPSIAISMNADAILLSWVNTAYLLSSAVFLLPIGKLADIFGRKRIYILGMMLVTLASILAALADTIIALISCRIIEGLGAAMLFSTGIAILSSVFPAEKRGGAIGLSISAVYLGLTCGPLFGGWLTQQFSWRAVFIAYIPVALFIIVISMLKLTGEWHGQRDQKFDFFGSFIYALAITSLMFGLSLLPSKNSIYALLVCTFCFTAFIRYERQFSNPIFEIKIFHQNKILTYSSLAALILYSATFSLTFLMSLYLQNIRGFSPQTAGLIILCQPLVMAILSPYTGKLSDRYESRYLTATGMCLVCLGLGLLSLMQQDTSINYILINLVLIGAGFALFSPPNVNAIMGSVTKMYLGIAAGTVSTTRVLGQMFSMAIITLAFAMMMGPVPLSPEHYPALLQSIRLSLFTAACLSFAGIYLSFARGNIR